MNLAIGLERARPCPAFVTATVTLRSAVHGASVMGLSFERLRMSTDKQKSKESMAKRENEDLLILCNRIGEHRRKA